MIILIILQAYEFEGNKTCLKAETVLRYLKFMSQPSILSTRPRSMFLSFIQGQCCLLELTREGHGRREA